MHASASFLFLAWSSKGMRVAHACIPLCVTKTQFENKKAGASGKKRMHARKRKEALDQGKEKKRLHDKKLGFYQQEQRVILCAFLFVSFRIRRRASSRIKDTISGPIFFSDTPSIKKRAYFCFQRKDNNSFVLCVPSFVRIS